MGGVARSREGTSCQARAPPSPSFSPSALWGVVFRLYRNRANRKRREERRVRRPKQGGFTSQMRRQNMMYELCRTLSTKRIISTNSM